MLDGDNEAFHGMNVCLWYTGESIFPRCARARYPVNPHFARGYREIAVYRDCTAVILSRKPLIIYLLLFVFVFLL